MSESAEVISNADADYGTDTETIPDARILDLTIPDLPIPDVPIPDAAIPELTFPDFMFPEVEVPKVVELRDAVDRTDPNVEKTSTDVIRETADNTQSCRVCYDEYHGSRNQARVLACGHTFCTRCVISCGSNGYTTIGIKCPECRKISDQAPATVPINFQLMQVLTALSLLKVAQTPEQEQELPNYENFERLGAHIPVNELTELTLKELFEHLKAVLNAIRLRARTEPKPEGKTLGARFDSEIARLEDLEKSMHRVIGNVNRLQRGDVPSTFLDYVWPVEDRAPMHDADWMREMVVYRPPNRALPDQEQPVREVAAVTPVQDVDTLLAREEVARAEADPSRNVHVVREAHLRRERENAQERQLALRNEQIMRDLLDDWDENDPIHEMNPQLRQRRLERTLELQIALRAAYDAGRHQENAQRATRGLPPLLAEDDVYVNDRDDESIGSDDSSFMDDPPAPMTIGEAITIYRLLEVFSPRTNRPGASALALPRNYPNLDALVQAIFPPNSSVNDPLRPLHLVDLRNYSRTNKVDAEHLLKCLRQHSIRFASNLVEAPRILENRRRRQRLLTADDYNARLRLIRKRATEALRGARSTTPMDEEEKNLTTRLIINLASTMGVRESLIDVICPNHQEIEEEKEVFVPKTSSGSSRQQILFCTACRCDVPFGSRQTHEEGRRHTAALANRTPTRQRRSPQVQ